MPQKIPHSGQMPLKSKKNLPEWGLIAICSLLPLAVVELVKGIQRIATERKEKPIGSVAA